MKDFLTVKEVAKQLKKHPGTIRRWIREKKLPATKLGGKYGVYVIERTDLLEFMMSRMSAAGSSKKPRRRRGRKKK